MKTKIANRLVTIRRAREKNILEYFMNLDTNKSISKRNRNRLERLVLRRWKDSKNNPHSQFYVIENANKKRVGLLSIKARKEGKNLTAWVFITFPYEPSVYLYGREALKVWLHYAIEENLYTRIILNLQDEAVCQYLAGGNVPSLVTIQK